MHVAVSFRQRLCPARYAVYQTDDPDDFIARLFELPAGLKRRPSGGDHVVDDDNRGSTRQLAR